LALALKELEKKKPPYNNEAEQSCLGSIIIDNVYIDEAIKRLKPEDFYFENHRHIYKTIIEIHDRGNPIDLVTLSNALNEKKLLNKIGGAEYLNNLADIVPSAANFEYYAQIVFEKALLRKLISAANQILSNAYEEERSLADIMDNSEKIIFDVTQRRITQDFIKISDSLSDTIKTIEKLFERKDNITGIPTGIHKLDDLTSGFQNSELIVIAGRPGKGKSSLAINIAEYAALEEKKRVAIFSLEMTAQHITTRLLGSQARVDISALRSGFLSDTDWAPIVNASSRLHDAPIYIDDTPGLGIMELRAKARRIFKQYKIDVILIDYMQLITLSSKRENRQQEISEISRSLKALARELKIPVIALSQLRRLQSEKDRPALSDLRESGAIEQDADVVILIHQKDVEKEYEQETDEETSKSSDILEYELLLEKQRNGPTGIINVRFLKRFTKFVNPAWEEIE